MWIGIQRGINGEGRELETVRNERIRRKKVTSLINRIKGLNSDVNSLMALCV